MWPFNYPVLDYLLMLGGLALLACLWAAAEAIGSNVKCKVRGYHEWQAQLSDWGNIVYHNKVCRICGAIDSDSEGTPKPPPSNEPKRSVSTIERKTLSERVKAAEGRQGDKLERVKAQTAESAEWDPDRSVAEYVQHFETCWYCTKPMELHTPEAIEAGYAIFTRFLTSTKDEYDDYILWTEEATPTKGIHNDGVKNWRDTESN